jgi:hypothetical protein
MHPRRNGNFLGSWWHFVSSLTSYKDWIYFILGFHTIRFSSQQSTPNSLGSCNWVTIPVWAPSSNLLENPLISSYCFKSKGKEKPLSPVAPVWSWIHCVWVHRWTNPWVRSYNARAGLNSDTHSALGRSNTLPRRENEWQAKKTTRASLQVLCNLRASMKTSLLS